MYICTSPNRILILENFGDYDTGKSLFVYDQKGNLIDEIALKDNSLGLFTEVVSNTYDFVVYVAQLQCPDIAVLISLMFFDYFFLFTKLNNCLTANFG
ncbi:MAG: hypothetical protein CO032_06480 [Nitrosopumilales archaeon CG_4_9_14_0_2_um_filter_34_16]|nr:MAG: hypothetical protein CO032_06480 [Nitrosopumilales archaeon CG_4_9_14_0_2_um_filter_34_16]